jgi:hypothetical protein
VAFLTLSGGILVLLGGIIVAVSRRSRETSR